MTTLKKYNLEGKAVGEVQVPPVFTNVESSPQSVKDYIVAIRANLRQWSANTQRRSEVNHSTKKPHPQKGTGRARQGSLASTQFRGGGRPFGPKPKFDQHIKINRKERRMAIRSLIADKISGNRVHIIENSRMDEPKTGSVAKFLNKVGLQRGLLVIDDVTEKERGHGNENFKLSIRNIPFTTYRSATTINGFDLVKAHDLLLTAKAFEQIVEWLSPGSETKDAQSQEVELQSAPVEVKTPKTKKAAPAKEATKETKVAKKVTTKAEKAAKEPKAPKAAAEAKPKKVKKSKEDGKDS